MAFLREVIPNIEQYVNLYYIQMLGFDKIDYDMDNNKDELSKDFLEHCDLLDKHWSETIRKKLMDYSYYQLAN